jgi:hypothetical protein
LCLEMKIWITHLGDKMILKENDKLLFYTNKDKFNFLNVSFISFLAITMFEGWGVLRLKTVCFV